MFLRLLLLNILMLPAFAALAAEDELNIVTRNLCGPIYLTSPEPIKFTRTEINLICGDGKTEAWRHIPVNQAVYFVRTFLQARGYLLVETDISKERVQITAKKRSLVQRVVIEKETYGIDVSRYWGVLGRPLTPETLNDLEAWLKQELAYRGIPCPRLKVTANPVTGIVSVVINQSDQHRFPPIESDGIPGLVGGVERRYDAFKTGELYDAMLLELSTRRMMTDEIVLSTHFLTDCVNNGQRITIKQRITPGDPRIVSFGIGFDTEEYFITRAMWKNTRLGSMGSQLEASATLSYRIQQARLAFDWYYVPIVTRHYLRSEASFRRENERRYDSRTLRTQTGPAWRFDSGGIGSRLWTSTAFQHVETVRGTSPSTSRLISLEVDFEAQTHEYEYYANDPRQGYYLRLGSSLARREIGSDITANKYSVATTALWNLFNFEPPIWVIGLRLAGSTTVSNKNLKELPPAYRYFLGGSNDLRGFGRNSLPTNDAGFLTAAHGGLEARMTSVIPFNLQPIVFLDVGRGGHKPMSFDKNVFWSPGFGGQWRSPFGTFRSTLAHGFIEGPDRENLDYLSRWQFYFSYGEQF